LQWDVVKIEFDPFRLCASACRRHRGPGEFEQDISGIWTIGSTQPNGLGRVGHDVQSDAGEEAVGVCGKGLTVEGLVADGAVVGGDFMQVSIDALGPSDARIAPDAATADQVFG
jgi:hypothetical protein